MAERVQDDLERKENFVNRVIVKEPQRRIEPSQSNLGSPTFAGLILI